MIVQVLSSAISGINAIPVRIEMHVSKGIRYSLVGLPDNAVKESHERIISALHINGMDIPRKQIIINMAPADIKKEGTTYDLPLAVALMAAGEHIPLESIKSTLFMGELSLDGSLNAVKGVLPTAILANELNIKRLIVPIDNLKEASIIKNIEVFGLSNLREVREVLRGNFNNLPEISEEKPLEKSNKKNYDFSDVKGQEVVKRAAEIASAGGHNIIMIGPPGSGKTMIANCMSGILPEMTFNESLETTKIYSVSAFDQSNIRLMSERPFRSPHHSTSSVALIGGGRKPQPGEISLSHNGILYLDELTEFNKNVLEVLRQPLEERKIKISRAEYYVEYPANFMLVASMNPCPCGYYGHKTKQCTCSPGIIHKYMNKISGPLMDRIDIHVNVKSVTFENMNDTTIAESSSAIKKRVAKCREIQNVRFRNNPGIYCNSQMNSKEIKKFINYDNEAAIILKSAMEKYNLSGRAYDRVLKVARTIADLDNSEIVKKYHISESLQFRILDK